MPKTESEEDLELTELDDELTSFTADLVSLGQNEPFLRELFTKQPGNWVDVFSLYMALGHQELKLKQLRTAIDGSLFVTWLDYPDAGDNKEFCVIIFFTPDSVWSNTAVYNKQRLMKNGIPHTNGASR